MRYLLIDGHPDGDRLTTGLLNHYAASAPDDCQIDRLILRDMRFEPILHKGYTEPQK